MFRFEIFRLRMFRCAIFRKRSMGAIMNFLSLVSASFLLALLDSFPSKPSIAKRLPSSAQKNEKLSERRRKEKKERKFISSKIGRQRRRLWPKQKCQNRKKKRQPDPQLIEESLQRNLARPVFGFGFGVGVGVGVGCPPEFEGPN